MRKCSLDDAETRMGPAAVKRPLTDPLGIENAALNYYELAPGDAFGFGYHRHADQEEVFYVQCGTVTFETEAGSVTVSADEAVRFGPGEWQVGRNEGEERVVALAMGAPRDAGETEMRRECPDCGERTPNRIEFAGDREALVTLCTDCGAETGRFT
jgi:mannose-6-phosphate isomerase-like protein (cupin superfamily)